MSSNPILTLFEDRTTTVSLTDQQRSELLALEKIWGSQNLILRADNRLLLKRYVGFVATPELQIQILPKIYQSDQPAADPTEEKEQAVQMLFRLLHFSGFLNVKDLPDPHQVSRLQHDLLEIFIHIFVKQFLHLFQRQIHKQYEEKEENATIIKGKILFQQTILNNGGFTHKHFIRYEEFTEDTLMNQIFKTIMLLLRAYTKNSENKKQLTIALTYLEDVKRIPLSSQVFEKVRFNRLNEWYRPLFEMARLFYLNQQPGLSAGDDRTFTFLVPLNQLFEYALYKLLRDACAGEKWDVHYQKPQYHLDQQSKFRLKPDIVVTDGYHTKVIVDAKYKNPVVDSKVSALESDVYQMLAYAVGYKCDNLFLVYPRFIDNAHLSNPLFTSQIDIDGRTMHLRLLHLDLTEANLEQLKAQLLCDIKSAIGCEREV